MNDLDFFLQDYEQKTARTKVLLMFLLLEPGNLLESGDVYFRDETADLQYGRTITKKYAFTDEYVDTAKIDRQLESLPTPVICSKDSFAHYAETQVLYKYIPEDPAQPLCINDIGVVSNVMLIDNDINLILSSNMAKSRSRLTAEEYGFPYFETYVRKNRVQLLEDTWDMTYEPEQSLFTVTHKDYGTLYQAHEMDKTSTYRLVLYVIKKLAGNLPAYEDNYKIIPLTRKRGV